MATARRLLSLPGNLTATVGGSGDAGTISGYDVITNFTTSKDLLTIAMSTPVAAANTAGTTGTASTLTIGGNTVKSHAISNGVITFSTNSSYSSPVSLTSLANVAAVIQYLEHTNLGNGSQTDRTVAFTATINSVAHTYIL